MARSADASLLSFLIILSPAGATVLPLLAQSSARVVHSFCVVLRLNFAEVALGEIRPRVWGGSVAESR
jgi:hypothetical protein